MTATPSPVEKPRHCFVAYAQDASTARTSGIGAPTSEVQYSPNSLAGNVGGNRFARLIPAVTIATLVGYGGQSEGATNGAAITAWLDASSQRTWEGSQNDQAFASTQFEAHVLSQHLAIKPVVEPDRGQSIQDQPRFSYQKAMAYADEMGLRTEFPL